jgi:hypothetical protein
MAEIALRGCSAGHKQLSPEPVLIRAMFAEKGSFR